MAEDHPHRPNLHNLLRERLPQLGLDADMYGPYIWGDEDDQAEDERDDDELSEVVLGVLQASSETHSDDDNVWVNLIEDIKKANNLDAELRRQEREKHLQETKTKMEEDLARAKLEEQEQIVEEEKKKSSQVDDEQKRILMQRYGYDKIEDEDTGSGFGANSSGAKAKKSSAAAATTTATNNKDAAKAAYAEKSREMRNAQKSTKAEERKKTKEQKNSKAALKEARRKRAQKGERKAWARCGPIYSALSLLETVMFLQVVMIYKGSRMQLVEQPVD